MAAPSSVLTWRFLMDRGAMDMDRGYSSWGHKESDMTEQQSTAVT